MGSRASEAGSLDALMRAEMALKEGCSLLRISSIITASVVVRKAPALSARRRPVSRSVGEPEDTASTHKWTSTSGRAPTRSSTDCKTHTCASSPAITRLVRPAPVMAPETAASASIEKVVFSKTPPPVSARQAVSSSATVRPRPLGYCSVTIAGIESSRAVASSLRLPETTAGNLWIAGRNRSWTSQMRKSVLSGVSRPRRIGWDLGRCVGLSSRGFSR
mmetsp:Transcript_47397/g.153164  ORF Transcript_47397/g.153164 Transcript_47397/m.153164 type:complete len:219 (-) Transcript_47397:16-672(-)